MISSLPFLLLIQEHGAAAAEGAEAAPGGLLSPHGGLMFWTLVIFVILSFILSRYAFKPITAAVEKREQALERAIAEAKADRDAAATLLAEHRSQLDNARNEAQKLIVEGRTIGDKIRADMIEDTRSQQQDMLERARREIESEKVRAIAELRREAVDLAIAGASKVIEKNLDDDSNRRIVESFLSSIPASPTGR
ncbi:MAG TPA: F0F1 ATP synthase subunit B [Gemmatimonadaceae bacterium]|nr:F0F1 ATP synthase subunit B [Gemmatimonadaceae bacterium]